MNEGDIVANKPLMKMPKSTILDKCDNKKLYENFVHYYCD